MPRNVTLVELNIYDNMFPLVSGYLQAYACKDPLLRRSFHFDKFTATTKTNPVNLIHELSRNKSDVYAFSCYLWNMALIKSILPPLMNMQPNAYFLLGGPQVMHHAHDYLDPENERLLLCNGEGEKPFAGFLSALTEARPDFSKVRGLSFYDDGVLVTTEQEERIRHLDDIPSPFLTGLFDQNYQMSIIETNRGCPFHCGFCFWGAATNDRVVKFDEERIKEELTWLSRRRVPFFYIADANWGMLKRDIDLSRHIAACKQQHKVPLFIYFSAAKNSPHRVAEITEIFTEAGLLNAQPISMQSLNTATLDHVERTNIKLSAFEDLQKDLNQKEISSFIELIWPLPGETLSTFKSGIENLAEREAAVLIVYPQLLLHNTPLYRKQKEYGLVTRTVQDGAAEAELVVETADVSRSDFEEGIWYYYTTMALFNARSIPHLSRYLHKTGTISYSALYTAFTAFCQNDENHPLTHFCRQSIADAHYFDVGNYPMIYHIILHAERAAFDRLLYNFVSSQPWWSDECARTLFELDGFNRPFVYSNTPIKPPDYPLQHIKCLEVNETGRSFLLEIPRQYLPFLDQTVVESTVEPGDDTAICRLDHAREQFPYSQEKGRRDNAEYCHGTIMRIAKILPVWTAEPIKEGHQHP